MRPPVLEERLTVHERGLSGPARSAVGVVGNLNMDLILRGVEAMPVWGRGVEASDYLLTTSGQGGYLALALAAQEVPTELIGNVGNDDFGRRIVADLAGNGVGTGGIEVSERLATGMCIAIARPGDGERAFIADLGQLVEYDAATVRRNWPVLATCAVVCVVGIFDMANFAAAGATEVLSRLRADGKQTLLDTGWDGDGWPPATLEKIHGLLPDVDYLAVNENEALAISGEAGPVEAARALQARSGHTVIVKRGKNGSFGRNEHEEVNVDAFNVVPADAVGAGDSYNAGFLAALLEGASLEECMRWGTATATLYIGRRCDRYPRRSEVAALLGDCAHVPPTKCVPIDEGR